MKSSLVQIHELNGGYFQASYINPITNKRKRRRFMTKKEAESFRAETEQKLHAQNYGDFLEVPVGILIERHLRDYPQSKLKDRANVFTSFYEEFSKLKLNQVTKVELQKWFERIRGENNYSDKTLSSIRSQINWFFKMLVEERLIEESPLDKIKFKRIAPPRRPRIVLSIDEVNQLLENAKFFSPEGLYPFLSTVAHTGIRRSEALNLTRTDIDFSTRLIHIRKSKNGRERFIVMSPTIESVLKEYLYKNESHVLFQNEHGTKLNSNKELSRLIDKFKAYFPMDKNWGCHSLRHSFAYNFLKKG
ncbi:MAG: tyrosine-type recombinase/integrase, partial [Bdellovibrionales bacterium]|nr:tyrosine-type recombinase/integrase [Bdellovibrionales bacterium]